MTTATVTNSKPARKQLSDQLDRLDCILDALSDGLNGAVADAAREGTRLAVKDAIIEIITDPILRCRLREAAAPEPASHPTQPPSKPGFWSRLKAKAVQAAAVVSRAASGFVDGAIRGVKMVADVASHGLHAIKDIAGFKKLALIAIGGAIAAGVVSFLAPHAMGAAAVRVSVWSRRAFGAFAIT